MPFSPFILYVVALLPIICTTSLPLSLSSSSSELIVQQPCTKKNRCVDCAIIGGGPAGLATSIAIANASPSSTIAIFERDNFEPKGASIQISKLGFDSIKKLEESVIPLLDEVSVPVYEVETNSWTGDDKQHDAAAAVNNNNEQKLKVDAPRTVMNKIHLWHDVRIIFANQACQIYANNQRRHGDGESLLNTNCNLIDIRPLTGEEDGDSRFELTFKHATSGEEITIRTRYLFAADGTKSKVRNILPKEPNILLPENKSVWRGMAPNINAHGKATFYRGTSDDNTAGRSALVFPGGKDAGSSWTVISDVEDGKSESIAEAKARVLKVIQTTMGRENCRLMTNIIQDSNIVIENKLFVRDFNQPWESSYDGLIYLGDAAHPVRPTGQGAALAFEDAAVL